MIRRPPRSTRTDARFPYTTVFRSPGRYKINPDDDSPAKSRSQAAACAFHGGRRPSSTAWQAAAPPSVGSAFGSSRLQRSLASGQRGWKLQHDGGLSGLATRSEERRGGKECVSKVKSRWAP